MKSGEDLVREAREGIEEVSVDDLVRERSEDGELLVLDVREQNEIEQGTIPGSVWIPRGFLELKIEQAVPDRERRMVVYCGGGVRSALAVQTLNRMGYDAARSLAGGFAAWRRSGNSVESR